MEKTKQQKAKDFIINNGVIIVMFILVIYTGLTSDNFLTRNNLMNILMNMSSRLVIALGIAGCVITAGCDLSAGRMIGFAACIAGTLLQRIDYSGKFFPDMQPMNVFLALIVVMAICAAFGSITGFFIAYLSVPPFIATLAMMEIVYGISLIYTGATPLGGYVKSYTDIANGKFLGISWLIWIAILVAVITWFIFNMTRHGKYMYAIGGNPQAAEVAGVPVKKTLILIYMKAAAMYGLAGFMLGAKAGGASVQTGYGYEMEAIAACTIGGVSVTGGRGKVSSAIIGVAVFELLKVALQYLGMNANAQYIAIGVVIFVAVFLHNGLGYLLGYGAGRLTGMNTAKKRTISIEVGMQNAGLATNLATTTAQFAVAPESAIICAVSCTWHSISGTLLAGLFAAYDKRKAGKPANKKQAAENVA